MKTAQYLTSEQLVRIVERVQSLLYLDTDDAGAEFWNPDKNWTPDTLEGLAQILTEYGLVPTEASQPQRMEELSHLVTQIEQRANSTLLDDRVIDLKCGEASTLNNSGVEAQMQYIAWQLGPAETIRQVSELLNEADADVAGDG